MGEGGADRFADLVENRTALLEALTGDPRRKSELVERLDVSRSTVDRAVRKLRDAGLVERTDTRFVATAAGRVALANHQQYRRRAHDTAAATDVLARLPVDATPDIRMIEGSIPVAASEPAPYRPTERLHEMIRGADHYRGVLPALDAPRHVRLLYNGVVIDGGSAEVVASDDLFGSLRSEFHRQLTAMAETDRFEAWTGETPPYGLVRVDGEETAAALIAFSEEGTVAGLLENDTPSGVAWVDDRLDAIEAEADRVTDVLRSDDESGRRERRQAPDVEGFVRLTESFFLDRRVADPVTAWRAGLDLAEVRTGYSVDRTRTVDGAERSLTAELRERLRAGADIALLGPPGCGKSTVCKRVACEWYRDDVGTVFYREGARGGRFDDSDGLVEAVEAADGHRLVVVEDAVRPDAVAVFEAVQRLANRDDVSFLLDAREAEWRSQPGDRLSEGADGYRTDVVETVLMPPLSDRDREAIVEHVERTTPEPVSIPLEQLRTDIERRDEEAAAPGEVLLLLHRAARYADPLADDATALEADVADVYERLADEGEAVLGTGVLVNLLNAAGGPVEPATLRRLNPDEQVHEAAVDVLTGRVLFETGDRYRTVHEAWSVAFLRQVRDAEPSAAAADRFGRCVTAVLELADDPDPGADLGRQMGVADATEQLFTLGVRYPKLAPLYGDSTDDRIELPEAAGEELRLRCLGWRGEMNRLAGRYDAATAEYRRLRERTPAPGEAADDSTAPLHVEALLGLATTAESRGEYDEARSYAERALDGAEALADLSREARATVRLGRLRRDAGDMAAARTDFEAALERAREADDSRAEMEALLELGLTATHSGEYDRGIEYNRRALELARRLGNRKKENRAAGELGLDYLRTGETERAARWVQQSLDISREVGDRQAESAELTRLGLIEIRRGNYERARERFEAAAEIERETGNERDAKLSLLTLGKANYYCGDLDVAAEYAERGLEHAEEMEMPRAIAAGRTTLARVACDRGDYDDAATHAETAIEASRKAGLDGFEADARCVRGRAERERGEYEAAEATLADARELAAEMGETQTLGRATLEEARLAADRRDEAATERFRAAVDRLEDAGATRLALVARLELVDACRRSGSPEAASRVCEAGREVAADAGFDDLRTAFDDRLDSLD